MKVLFVYPTFESLGIEYCSAVLKQAGHAVKLLFDPRLFDDLLICNYTLKKIFDLQKRLIAQAIAYSPDIICFSVCYDNYNWSQEYARKLKETTGAVVVFGGVHPTTCPEEILRNPFVDYVIRGEGEYALADLIEAIMRKESPREIKNLCYRAEGQIVINPLRPLVNDLDSLPFPDKSIYDGIATDFSNGYRIIATRGCPFSCSYCFSSVYRDLYATEEKIWRKRSVSNVITELRAPERRRPIKYVIFDDELFPADIQWLEQFKSEYTKYIDVPFSCFVHPLMVSAQQIELLESAGCVSVFMGLDSIDRMFNRCFCNRDVSAEEISRAVTIIRASRIALYGGYIVGYPTQTIESILADLQFYNRHKPDSINVHWIRYFPGTQLRDTVQKQGFLKETEVENKEKNAISCRLRKDFKKNKEFVGLINLFYLMCLLPQSIISFLIKVKAYRLLRHIYCGGFWIASCLNMKNRIWAFSGIKKRNVRFVERRRFYLKHIVSYILSCPQRPNR